MPYIPEIFSDVRIHHKTTKKPYSRNFQSKRLSQKKFSEAFGEENNSEQQSLGLRISWTTLVLLDSKVRLRIPAYKGE